MSEQLAFKMLGGARVLGRQIHSLLDISDLIEKGVPRKAAERLRAHLGLSEQELARSLGVSAKTLQRQAKAGEARLSPAQSDRLYRLARIVALAEDVFENEARARRWLREPQRGLGGRVPLDLQQTEAGAREVEDLLGRIEYGVFS